jgi:hypothetical protein
MMWGERGTVPRTCPRRGSSCTANLQSSFARRITNPATPFTVAGPATAQGLPEPVQTSYDALPPDVQSIVGSVALSGPLGFAALYYFVWCPIVNGPWNPTPDSCSF